MVNAGSEFADEVKALKALFSDTETPVPAHWKLTATEERVFRVLLAVDSASRAAIAEGAKLKVTRTIDVHIARLRKKITTRGLEVETVRARGWRLVDRRGWARTLSAHTQS